MLLIFYRRVECGRARGRVQAVWYLCHMDRKRRRNYMLAQPQIILHAQKIFKYFQLFSSLFFFFALRFSIRQAFHAKFSARFVANEYR